MEALGVARQARGHQSDRDLSEQVHLLCNYLNERCKFASQQLAVLQSGATPATPSSKAGGGGGWV